MKIRGLAIILSIILSVPIQSISVSASDIEINQSTETLVNESEQNSVMEESEEKIKEDEVVIEESEETAEEKENIDGIDNAESVQPIIETNDITQASSDFAISNGVLIKYNGTAENVVIPSNLGIKTIGFLAFDKNVNIKSVIIPEGVVSIQNATTEGSAFGLCLNLSTVTLPSTLTSIGLGTFLACPKLTNINIPSNVSYIGAGAFQGCSSLNNIVIPNKITTIQDGTFSGCNELTNISIPNSVTSIGASAFWYCNKLSQIDIPSSVTNIGKFAFMNCSSLTSFNIPNKVTKIEQGTFSGCINLTSIFIHNSITSIGSGAFDKCEKLSQIDIPSGVTSIGSGAFTHCTNLEKINISEGVMNIGMTAFSYCEKLQYIVIPESVTTMGSSVFYGCSNLKTVNFLGNAPSPSEEYGYGIFGGSPEGLIVYYFPLRTGFGNTGQWQGRTAMVYSADTAKINAFVTRLYENILNRKASSSEINYYADYLIAQYITGADAGRGFIFSPEFTKKNSSNSAYIDVLYQTFMGRASDQSGKIYWKNMLDNGVSREFVFKGFVESPEFTNICKSYGISRGNVNLTEPRDQNANLTMFISRCYQKALGRTAEANGLNYYAQEILLKRVTPLQASQNFIFSPEFKNKNLTNTDYVKVLYRTFMGREFDQDGLNYHLNRMQNGTSREEILLGFANSPEFKTIMSGFGL